MYHARMLSTPMFVATPAHTSGGLCALGRSTLRMALVHVARWTTKREKEKQTPLNELSIEMDAYGLILQLLKAKELARLANTAPAYWAAIQPSVLPLAIAKDPEMQGRKIVGALQDDGLNLCYKLLHFTNNMELLAVIPLEYEMLQKCRLMIICQRQVESARALRRSRLRSTT